MVTLPVSVSTSAAHRWVPCGKEKFSGSNTASESSEDSTPSGRLCPVKVANAISPMVTELSVPRTVKLPCAKSISSSDASSRCAAMVFALAITLSAALTTAMPPTASEREP